MSQFEANEFENGSEDNQVDSAKLLSRSLVNSFNSEPNRTPPKNASQRFLKKKTKPSESQYRLQAFLQNTEPSKLDKLDNTWKEQLQSG